MNNEKMSRRDFIKGVAATIGSLIGAVVALPTIAYLLSPALKEEQDTDSIDLGALADYPVGIPTRFATTRTRVNGWERTATNYGMHVVKKSDTEARVFSDICTHLGCRVTWHEDQKKIISVPVTTDTLISWGMWLVDRHPACWMNVSRGSKR